MVPNVSRAQSASNRPSVLMSARPTRLCSDIANLTLSAIMARRTSGPSANLPLSPKVDDGLGLLDSSAREDNGGSLEESRLHRFVILPLPFSLPSSSNGEILQPLASTSALPLSVPVGLLPDAVPSRSPLSPNQAYLQPGTPARAAPAPGSTHTIADLPSWMGRGESETKAVRAAAPNATVTGFP